VLAKDVICLLDVPVKTGSAFSKPVEPLLGQAIEAWQAVRPAQPASIDRKTGAPVHVLFSVRARAVAEEYINRTVIPSLCLKADVPDSDVRGKITSHRARSTIASQLYNAKEPMTLFELQASPRSRITRHHPGLRPAHPEHPDQGLRGQRRTRPIRQCWPAGYFERNVRTIRSSSTATQSPPAPPQTASPGSTTTLATAGAPYTFFEQCPHRMACARGDFSEPKESSKAQALQANSSLSRMLATSH
jgi:hypothetical protein